MMNRIKTNIRTKKIYLYNNKQIIMNDKQIKSNGKIFKRNEDKSIFMLNEIIKKTDLI